MEEYEIKNEQCKIFNNILGTIISLEAIVFGIIMGLKGTHFLRHLLHKAV